MQGSSLPSRLPGTSTSRSSSVAIKQTPESERQAELDARLDAALIRLNQSEPLHGVSTCDLIDAARRYENNNRHMDAFDIYFRMAVKGDRFALPYLQKMLLRSNHNVGFLELVRNHCESADRVDMAVSTFVRGFLYQHGLGVEQDAAEAEKLYKEAWEVPQATKNLGEMYEFDQVKTPDETIDLDSFLCVLYQYAHEMKVPWADEDLARVTERMKFKISAANTGKSEMTTTDMQEPPSPDRSPRTSTSRPSSVKIKKTPESKRQAELDARLDAALKRLNQSMPLNSKSVCDLIDAARRYEDNNRHMDAFDIYFRMAVNKNRLALTCLQEMLLRSRHKVEFLESLRNCCEKVDVDELVFVRGILYQHGLGVEQDLEEARKLYKKAWGVPESSNNLGLMYETGQAKVPDEETDVDFFLSLHYRYGTDMGVPGAAENLARVTERMKSKISAAKTGKSEMTTTTTATKL